MTVLLRMPEVERHFGSRSSVYRAVHAEILPPPVQVGLNSVAWVADEIDAVLRLRAAGGTHDEVRQLVRSQVHARGERKRAILLQGEVYG